MVWFDQSLTPPGSTPAQTLLSVNFLKREHYKHSLITWGVFLCFFFFFFSPTTRKAIPGWNPASLHEWSNYRPALGCKRVKVAAVNKYKTTEETVKWDKSESSCYLQVGGGGGEGLGRGGVQCTFNISATSLTCYKLQLIQKSQPRLSRRHVRRFRAEPEAPSGNSIFTTTTKQKALIKISYNYNSLSEA